MANEDKGLVISPRDVPLFERLMDDYQAGALGPGPDNTRRRRPGGGGGGSKIYATIVRSLQRPDPTTTPATEAITSYRVKLSAEGAFAAWSGTHDGEYEAGDKVLWTDGLDYEALTTHTAAEGKSPDNPSYWTLASIEAYILGYSGDLIGTVPWFIMDEEVEVVQRDGTYYIHETAAPCEYIEGEYLTTSVQWNDDQKRVMAVFK